MGPKPLIVSYGAGRDSTAMLIEMHRRGIRPGAILFANVGSEKRATYAFIPTFNQWLLDHEFPPITVVRYRPVSAPYHSLEGNTILNATLPGATFNRHTCTVKFKIAPQNRWTSRWEPAQRAWAAGQKVIKLIGFECDEVYRLKRADARAHSGKAQKNDAERYEYQFPLMDWGYDLARCMQIIDDAGLPMPPKSACYMCPNQKPQEVRELSEEDRARVILMEVVAEPYNQKVRGLWRRPRKKDGRPGSITELILREGLSFTPLTELGRRVVLNPRSGKAKNSGQFTFHPPHSGPTLRELLQTQGHEVPEVVVDNPDASDAYQEDWRGIPASLEEETDQHLGLVGAL